MGHFRPRIQGTRNCLLLVAAWQVFLRKNPPWVVSSRRKQAGCHLGSGSICFSFVLKAGNSFVLPIFSLETEDPRSSRLTTFGWETGFFKSDGLRIQPPRARMA